MRIAAALVELPLPVGEGRAKGRFLAASLWACLAGEVGATALLFLSDRLPPVLIRGLQLFLSF